MSTHAVPPTASFPMLALPNELQLEILSNLPGKELQRARRVCSHFRALIDRPANQTFLIRAALEHNRARLEQVVAAFEPSDKRNPSTQVPDLLRILMYVSHFKGNTSDSQAHRTIPGINAYLYTTRHPDLRLLKLLGINKYNDILAQIKSIAELLLCLRNERNHTEAREIFEPPLGALFTPDLRSYGLTHVKRHIWLRTINHKKQRNAPNGRHERPPRNCLTPIGGVAPWGYNAFSLDCDQISEMFGLPQVPACGAGRGWNFGFAVKADWAYAIVQSKICLRNGEISTLTELAAMEEVRIA